MPQSAPLATVAVNRLGKQSPLKVSGNKELLSSAGGVSSSLALGAATTTVIKAAPGRICSISVTTAGTTVGAVYDSKLTTGNSAKNQLFVIPNTVGVTKLEWPCSVGIVITTGTGQTVSVSYI